MQAIMTFLRAHFPFFFKPHTLAAAVADVQATIDHLGLVQAYHAVKSWEADQLSRMHAQAAKAFTVEAAAAANIKAKLSALIA